MSNMTSKLVIDGVEVEDGAVEVVAAYTAALREARDKLNEVRMLAASCPEAVKWEWLKRHDKARKALDNAYGPVVRFHDDYVRSGLDAAITDARWRKELPPA